MRQLLTTGIIALALLIGATGSAPVAHAQTVGANGTPCDFTNKGDQDGLWQSGRCVSNGTSGFNNTSGTQEQNITANKAGEAVTTDPVAAKSVVDYGAGGKEDAAYNSIMSKIMTLFAWLVGVAALTLDNAVFYTVVTMGGYLSHLTAIGVAWRILRDFGNIMLIFGFLAIGISVILNTERIGYGKKMLPMLLVAAVFLNFSLFFAEAIVDAGNLFATQFYTQINNGVPAGAKDFNLVLTGKEGISNIIMGQLGLQNIYGKALSKDADVFKGGNPWLIGFMGILLFLVTAFVMFSLAFILIARFVALIFLIVLAPIGFAGLAIPQLEKKASQWWGALIHQTLTAPILLLMLYVALAVITDANFLTGFGSNGQTGPDWLGFITNNGVPNLAGFGSAVLSFIVAMGLLIAVTIQAKNLSAFGADWATKTAGKLTFGATALGMRTAVGWPTQALSRGVRNSRFGATKTGRIVATTLDKGAKASFDVRGATIGGGLKGIGVVAGEAQKGGYREREKKGITGHEEYAKSLTGRGQTREEKKVLVEKEEVEKKMQTEHDTAKAEHTAVSGQVAMHDAEVKRLTEINKDNKSKGIFDQKVTDDLKNANQNLSTSQNDFKVADAKLNQTLKDLNAAKEDRAKEKSKIESATSAKGVQQRYGENIQNAPLRSWALFGSGGQIAAKKIIREASKKQTDAEKFLEAMKLTAKKEAEEEAKKKAATATPSATPTPPAGGGAHP